MAFSPTSNSFPASGLVSPSSTALHPRPRLPRSLSTGSISLPQPEPILQPSRYEKDRPRHVVLSLGTLQSHAFGPLSSPASRARFSKEYFASVDATDETPPTPTPTNSPNPDSEDAFSPALSFSSFSSPSTTSSPRPPLSPFTPLTSPSSSSLFSSTHGRSRSFKALPLPSYIADVDLPLDQVCGFAEAARREGGRWGLRGASPLPPGSFGRRRIFSAPVLPVEALIQEERADVGGEEGTDVAEETPTNSPKLDSEDASIRPVMSSALSYSSISSSSSSSSSTSTTLSPRPSYSSCSSYSASTTSLPRPSITRLCLTPLPSPVTATTTQHDRGPSRSFRAFPLPSCIADVDLPLDKVCRFAEAARREGGKWGLRGGSALPSGRFGRRRILSAPVMPVEELLLGEEESTDVGGETPTNSPKLDSADASLRPIMSSSALSYSSSSSSSSSTSTCTTSSFRPSYSSCSSYSAASTTSLHRPSMTDLCLIPLPSPSADSSLSTSSSQYDLGPSRSFRALPIPRYVANVDLPDLGPSRSFKALPLPNYIADLDLPLDTVCGFAQAARREGGRWGLRGGSALPPGSFGRRRMFSAPGISVEALLHGESRREVVEEEEKGRETEEMIG